MPLTWEPRWYYIDLNRYTRANSQSSTCKRFLVAEMNQIDGMWYLGRKVYYAIHASDGGFLLISTHRQIRAAQRACEKYAESLRARHLAYYLQ